MSGVFGTIGVRPDIRADGQYYDTSPASHEPLDEAGVLIETRRTWSEEWTPRPEIVPLRAEIHTASVGGWRCEFSRTYGPAETDAGEDAFVQRAPLDLVGHWVRVRLLPRGVPHTIWVGRVDSEVHRIDGASGTAAARGRQTWVALGPDRLLEKLDFYESYWEVSGAAQRLGWQPDFNLPPAATFATTALRGNRSSTRLTAADESGGPSYVFGGTDLWTHYDILEYVLERFVNQPGGPVWTIGGQSVILRGQQGPVHNIPAMISRIAGEPAMNVADLIRRCIPIEFGVDYVIVPHFLDGDQDVVDGFEIRVFSTVGASQIFGGNLFPANSVPVVFDVASGPADSCEFDAADSMRYDRIRVIGNRIVTCLSFGSGAQTALEAGWTAADESAYEQILPGNQDPKVLAAARADDRWRDVFQKFVFGETFSWQGRDALPTVALDGALRNGDAATPFQTSQRETLPYIPLREAVLYDAAHWTGAPVPVPTDTSPNRLHDFRPLYGVVAVPGTSTRYIPVDQLGTIDRRSATIGALDTEWGVRLRSEPNHAFARGSWDDPRNPTEGEGVFDVSDQGVDWRTLEFTVALESDHRLQLGSDLPANQQSGERTTLVIHVPDAYLIYLAPLTLVGVDATTGAKLRSPQTTTVYRYPGSQAQTMTLRGALLRDDRYLLLRVMAGAVARYQQQRARVTLSSRFLATYSGLLGQFLDGIRGAPNTPIRLVQAAITSVVWDFVARMTTLNAGQATRTGTDDLVLQARRFAGGRQTVRGYGR
jgi:hypothetical protein